MPDTILDLYELHGVEIRSKAEWSKWWKLPVRLWWHLLIPMFFWCVGIFSKDIKEEFHESYFTTVDKTVWCPEEDYQNILVDPHDYRGTLRHELVHVFDMLRDGRLRFWLRYLLRKKWRAYYERRGYTQTMIVIFERRGRIPLESVQSIISKFTGKMYWRMDPDAAPKIHDIRTKIYSGEYQGFYPNVI